MVSAQRRAPPQSAHSFVSPNDPSGHVKHRSSLVETLLSGLVHVTLHVAPIATSVSHTAQRVSVWAAWRAGCERATNDPCTGLL